jgi:septum formation inhibitor MinC
LPASPTEARHEHVAIAKQAKTKAEKKAKKLTVKTNVRAGSREIAPGGGS